MKTWTTREGILILYDPLFLSPLTLYDLGERISSAWAKFRFKKKKGSMKKFPMSAASMSR